MELDIDIALRDVPPALTVELASLFHVDMHGDRGAAARLDITIWGQ